MRDTIKAVYFSPTGTTRTITTSVALAIGSIDELIDLTHYRLEAAETPSFEPQDLVVFGVPVYGGRAQKDAVAILRELSGNGARFVAVVVYGNRAFEDALLELLDAAAEAGFEPLAAAAFVGEHSYSTEAIPIAHGRPDAGDLEKAAAFGRAVKHKLDMSAELAIAEHVPGNRPYRQVSLWQEMAPTVNHDACIQCGVCVTVCPNGANQLKERIYTDKSRCMMCCACIKSCPVGARAIEERAVQFARKLSVEQSDRKEPVWYL